MSSKIDRAKQCVSSDTKLSFIFKEQPSLAWQMVQQECNIYTNPNVDVQQINKLSSILSKIVQKLNLLQDPRQKYFNNKMQKLMAQPFVIRCYTDFSQKKQSNTNLNQKRKQLEQKLSIQAQRQNSQAFQHILNFQNQKQKKLQQKIQQVLGEHQKSLQNRLQLRSMKKQLSSPKKKNSEDTGLNNSQFGNPESKSPGNQSQFTMLDLTAMKNRKEDFNYSNRTRSQRIMNYQFNLDSSDNDSQDQYRIQKLLKQEKNMTKKKKIQFQNSQYDRVRK